jgi:hypothetical protein
MLRKASLLDGIASHPAVDDVTRALKSSDGNEVESQLLWDRYWAQEEQEEENLAFELLSMKGPTAGLRAEENSYLKDLRFLRGVFHSLEGIPPRRSREIAKERFHERFGRPPGAPPPTLAKELRAVRRKRRRREKREAESFRRQLGNPNLGAALSQLPPDKQGQRISEYRRAIKGEKRFIPDPSLRGPCAQSCQTSAEHHTPAPTT